MSDYPMVKAEPSTIPEIPGWLVTVRWKCGPLPLDLYCGTFAGSTESEALKAAVREVAKLAQDKAAHLWRTERGPGDDADDLRDGAFDE